MSPRQRGRARDWWRVIPYPRPLRHETCKGKFPALAPPPPLPAPAGQPPALRLGADLPRLRSAVRTLSRCHESCFSRRAPGARAPCAGAAFAPAAPVIPRSRAGALRRRRGAPRSPHRAMAPGGRLGGGAHPPPAKPPPAHNCTVRQCPGCKRAPARAPGGGVRY